MLLSICRGKNLFCYFERYWSHVTAFAPSGP